MSMLIGVGGTTPTLASVEAPMSSANADDMWSSPTDLTSLVEDEEEASSIRQAA